MKYFYNFIIFCTFFSGLLISFSVIAQTPSVPGTPVHDGTEPYCQGGTSIFTTTDVGADYYEWTFPTLSTSAPVSFITPQASITVTWSNTWYGIGQIKVKACNNPNLCSDDSPPLSFTITSINPGFTIGAGYNPTDCQSVPVQFNNTTQGTGNTYSWNFGDGSPFSNQSSPSHVFNAWGSSGSQTFTVTLAVTNSLGCSKQTSQSVTRQKAPGLVLIDATPGGEGDWKDCFSQAPSTLVVQNTASGENSITSFTIDWGEGIPVPFPGNFTSQSHTYNADGVYTITVTATNGTCSHVETHKFFKGGYVTISCNTNLSPGCVPHDLEFCFTQDNPPGTIYKFWFENPPSDAANNIPFPDLQLTQQELEALNGCIDHTYNESSCGNNANNSFNFYTYVDNVCSQAHIQLGPIYIANLPEASFTANSTACTNQPFTITNTSTDACFPGYSVTTLNSINWGDSENWYLISSGNISHTYLTQGNYTITLTSTSSSVPAGFPCYGQSDSVTLNVCVESAPQPAFSLSPSPPYCVGQNICITNSTPNGLCSGQPVYLWNPGGGSFTSGTNTSVNPCIIYNTTGNKTITLTATTCNSANGSQSFQVIDKPGITVNLSSSFCGEQDICFTNSVITYNTNGSSITGYNWSLPTGVNFNSGSGSTDPNPCLHFNNVGLSPSTYIVTVTATNSCGTTTKTISVTINPLPDIFLEAGSSPNPVSICSDNTISYNFISTVPGTSFTWVPYPPGLGGIISNPVIPPTGGYGNIPNTTLTNKTSAPITFSIIVTPVAGTCNGSTLTISITVNPAPEFSPTVKEVCSGSPFSFDPKSSSDVSVPLNPTDTYTWCLSGSYLPNIVTSCPTNGTSPFIGVIFNTAASVVSVQTLEYNYTISSNGAYTCLGTSSLTVEVIPVPTITNPANDSICCGESFSLDLNTTLPADWPSGTTDFTWSRTSVLYVNCPPPSGNTDNINQTYSCDPPFSTPGTLTYTINSNTLFTGTSLACPSDPVNFDVTINPNPTAIINPPPQCPISVICGSSTSLSACGSTGGLTPYNYFWSNNTTNCILTTPPIYTTITYCVTATDSNTCKSTACCKVEPGECTGCYITVTDNCLCKGESTTLTAVPSGGGGSYSYDWGGGFTNNPSITDNPNISTDYTVTVSDGFSTCIASATVTVNPLPDLKDFTYNGQYCTGQSPCHVTFTGMQAGMKYYLNPYFGYPAISPATCTSTGYVDFGILTAGCYTVIAMYDPCGDGNLCSKDMDGLICCVENSNPTAIINPPPQCPISVIYGSSTSLNACGSTGGLTPYNYYWSNNTTNCILTTPPIYTTITYCVTVTDSDICKSTACCKVEPGECISCYITVTDNCLCDGEYTTLTAVPSGGEGSYQYNWGSGFTNNPSITDNPNISTDYTVTVQDSYSSCIATAHVTVNPLPELKDFTYNGQYCTGQSPCHVTFTGMQAGMKYYLVPVSGSLPSGAISPATCNGSGFVDFGDLTDGCYTVIAMYDPCGDGNLCSRDMDGLICCVENPVPEVKDIICSISSYPAGLSPPGGVITVNGLQPDIIYLLYDNNGLPCGGCQTFYDYSNNIVNFSQVPAGYWCVKAVDPLTLCEIQMNGCCEIIENPLPIAFNVTGGGCYCSGSDGIDICLSDSEFGIIYELLYESDPLPVPVIHYGDGNPFCFAPQTIPGTYTVLGINPITQTPNMMNGSVTVCELPVPISYNFQGYGSLCQDDAFLYLQDSQLDIVYQLMYSDNGGSPTPYGPPVTGSGSVITFNDFAPFPWDVGEYTVVAYDPALTCPSPCNAYTPTVTCEVDMIGSVVINPVPQSYPLYGVLYPDIVCVGDEVNQINSELNTTYYLYKVNGGQYIQQIPGTGFPIIFGPFQVSGEYYVIGVNQFGCMTEMANHIFVYDNPVVYTVFGVPYNSGCAPIDIFLNDSQEGVIYRLILTQGTSLPIMVIGPILSINANIPLYFGTFVQEGIYTVEAYLPPPLPYCNSVMDGEVEILHTPLVQNMTPMGVNCVPSQAPIPIGLANSETGVTYQLYLNGNPTSLPTQAGTTGLPVQFGAYYLSGTYTAIGTDDLTGCITEMNGPVFINNDPSIYSLMDINFNICPGILCQGSTIFLSGSQPSVTYQLQKNGIDYGPEVQGNGNPIPLGIAMDIGDYTAYAYYTIPGTPAEFCPVQMNCTIHVILGPIPYQLSCCTDPAGTLCSNTSCCYCQGQANSLIIKLIDSQPGVSYQLYNGTVAQGIAQSGTNFPLTWNISAPGTYNVMGTVITPPTCSAWMTGTIVIDEDLPPVANAGVDIIVCYNTMGVQLSDATATLYTNPVWTTSGDGSFDNTANINATYTPGSNDILFGSVVLTLCVNGSECCTAMQVCDQVTITFDEPDVSISPLNPTIGDCPDQTIVLTAIPNNGYSPYSYQWSGQQFSNPTAASTNVTITGPGSQVSITITDFYGCQATASVSFTVDITPVVTATASSTDGNLPGTTAWLGDCNQLSHLAANATPLANIVGYSWDSPGGGYFSTPTNSTTDYYPPGIGNFSINVTVTDIYGCTATTSVTVIVASKPSINITAVPQPGTCTTVLQPLSITDGVAALTIGSGMFANFIASGTGTSPLTFSWQQIPVPSVPSCPLNNLSPSSWEFTPCTANTSYTYKFTITDIYGCTSTATIIINVDSEPAVSVTGTGQCLSGTFGPELNAITIGYDPGACCTVDLTATGTGSGQLGYQWIQFNPPPPPFYINPLQEITTTFIPPGPGNYTYMVTISDAWGCTATSLPYTIIVEDQPIANASVTGSCSSGNFTQISPTDVTIGGTECCTAILTGIATGNGAACNWSPPAGLGSCPNGSSICTFTPPSLSLPTMFTYTMTATDTYGCTDFDQVNITVDPVPSLTLTATASGCTNPPPAVSFTNSDGIITIGSGMTVNISALGSGTSPFAYNWTQLQPDPVSSPCPLIPVGLSSWTFDPCSASTTVQTIYQYQYTVTDFYGCQKKSSLTIFVDPIPAIDFNITGNCPSDIYFPVISQPNTVLKIGSCCNATLCATGTGIAPVSYLWNQLFPLSPPLFINNTTSMCVTFNYLQNATPGTYSYSTTLIDGWGCTVSSDTLIIIIDNPPITNANVTGNCPISSGGISPNIDIGFCCTSDIQIQGCGLNPTLTWSSLTNLSPCIPPVSPPNCTTDCQTFTPPVSSTPANYFYTIITSDDYGCTSSSAISITVNNFIIEPKAQRVPGCSGNPAGNPSNNLSIGYCDCAQLDANPSPINQPSLQPYTFLWDDTQCIGCLTSTSIQNPVFTPPLLTTQVDYDFTVTVTDFYGCQQTGSVTIHVPAIMDLTMQFQPNVPCPFCTGVTSTGWCDYIQGTPIDIGCCCVDNIIPFAKIRVYETGGTPTYTYQWNQVNPVPPDWCINPLNPAVPPPTNNSTVDFWNCQGCGIPYSYTITVTDNFGCAVTADIIINVAADPTVTATINSTCIPPETAGGSGNPFTTCTSCSVSFNAIPSGVSPFSYLWSCPQYIDNPFTGSPNVTVTTSGNYTCSVTATDSWGCESDPASVTLTIVDPVINSVAIQPNITVYCDNDVITFTANVTVDCTPVFNWFVRLLPSWTLIDSGTGNPVSLGPYPVGNYIIELQVIDCHGCVETTNIPINVGFASPVVAWSFFIWPGIGPVDATCLNTIVPNGISARIAVSGSNPFTLSNPTSTCSLLPAPIPVTTFLWDVPWHNPIVTNPQFITNCCYLVTVTDVNGCEVVAEDVIELWPVPIANFNNCPAQVCECEDAILQVVINGTPLGTQLWDGSTTTILPNCSIAVSYVILPNTTTVITQLFPLSPPTFVCNITIPHVCFATTVQLVDVSYDCITPANFECSGNILANFATCDIVIDPLPTFYIDGDLAYCQGSTAPIDFDVIITNQMSPGPYNVCIIPPLNTIPPTTSPNCGPYVGTAIPISVIPQPPPPAGTYIVTVTDNNGCTSEEDLDFIERPLPDITSSSAPQDACDGDCGVLIIITLTGTGPWEIIYIDTYDNLQVSITVPPNSLPPVLGPYTGTFEICLNGAGIHNITFLQVYDIYCSNNNLTQNNFAITVHDLPDGQFSAGCSAFGPFSNQLDVCESDNYVLKLELTGIPPWLVNLSENNIPLQQLIINDSPYIINNQSCDGDKNLELISVTDNPVPGLNCTSYINQAVIVHCLEPPTAKFCCSDAAICENECTDLCINLTADPSCNKGWIVVYSDGTNLVTIPILPSAVIPYSYEFPVCPITTTTYTLISVSYSQQCGDCACPGIVYDPPVTITVHPAVKYTCLFDPDHICIGTPTFFKIIITSGTPPFDITYNDGIQNVTLIGITANPVLIPVVPTAECLLVYTVIEISDAWNCKNDIPQSATLFIESKPTFDIIPCNSQIPDNQILNVFNLTTSCRAALFYDYVWTVNNIIILQGNGVTVIPPITVSPPVTACLAITAWYPPQGSSNNNILCSNTEYCDYLNMTDCIIEVPDAFTPNNDGINDRLILVGDLQFFTKVELLIFNRQGKLIYEFVSVNDSWDGKWEEIPQESDIYAFQLKAFCINGEVIKKNGSIVLIR